jgi:hypothetical protein
VVGDVPGQLGQGLGALQLVNEVDLAAGAGLQRQNGAMLLALGEPVDLIVEVLGSRVIEDGARQSGQPAGRASRNPIAAATSSRASASGPAHEAAPPGPQLWQSAVDRGHLVQAGVGQNPLDRLVQGAGRLDDGLHVAGQQVVFPVPVA